MTDQELQLALAKKLPELMHYDKDFKSFWWNKPLEKVTDREWDWAVNQVYAILQKEDLEAPEHEQPMWFLGLQYHLRLITNSEDYVYFTWQQRAQALKEIGVI